MAEQKHAGKVLRGIDTVVQALSLEDFPCDKQALYYSVGDFEVENGKDGFRPLRDILDNIKKERFVSAEDAISSIRANAA